MYEKGIYIYIPALQGFQFIWQIWFVISCWVAYHTALG